MMLVTLEPNRLPRVDPMSSRPAWLRRNGRLVKVDQEAESLIVHLKPSQEAYQTIRSIEGNASSRHFAECESLMREMFDLPDYTARQDCLVRKVIPCLMGIIQSNEYLSFVDQDDVWRSVGCSALEKWIELSTKFPHLAPILDACTIATLLVLLAKPESLAKVTKPIYLWVQRDATHN